MENLGAFCLLCSLEMSIAFNGSEIRARRLGPCALRFTASFSGETELKIVHRRIDDGLVKDECVFIHLQFNGIDFVRNE